VELVDVHGQLVEVVDEGLELFGFENGQVERHALLHQFGVGPV
jgi:hypothetical protein